MIFDEVQTTAGEQEKTTTAKRNRPAKILRCFYLLVANLPNASTRLRQMMRNKQKNEESLPRERKFHGDFGVLTFVIE